jgi:hypothetical protein
MSDLPKGEPGGPWAVPSQRTLTPSPDAAPAPVTLEGLARKLDTLIASQDKENAHLASLASSLKLYNRRFPVWLLVVLAMMAVAHAVEGVFMGWVFLRSGQ